MASLPDLGTPRKRKRKKRRQNETKKRELQELQHNKL